jgi:riboflavin synthase
VFTGIVVEQGVVEAPAPALVLRSELVSSDVAIGDSVAIDGCCLTVTEIDGTTLGDRVAGDVINLEPALRVGDRMGGHWVQGHVDGVGRVGSLTPNGNAVEIWFEAPPAVLRYVIEKGSIAVNGVSLTVTGFDAAGFGVSLIPHTLEATNFGRLQVGDRVNLEADLFGKYVERLTTRGVPSEHDER